MKDKIMALVGLVSGVGLMVWVAPYSYALAFYELGWGYGISSIWACCLFGAGAYIGWVSFKVLRD